MKSDKNNSIILMTFFGTFGSILLGFIFFGKETFTYLHPAFQFITYGFFGALFFSLTEHKSVNIQIYSAIVLLILSLLSVGKHLTIPLLIQTAFFMGSLLLSVKLYHQILKRNPQFKTYWRSFILAILYAILNVIFGGIVFLVYSQGGFSPSSFIFTLAIYAFLIGLGIGFGTDFYFQNEKQVFKLFKI